MSLATVNVPVRLKANVAPLATVIAPAPKVPVVLALPTRKLPAEMVVVPV